MMIAIPNTCPAIVHAPAAPLTLSQIATPVPGPGEVLIAVAVSGLNRADLAQRAGVYPPPPGASPVMGLEVAGTVAACGPQTTRFKIGDRVCALLAGGGYAAYAAADEGSVLPLPDSMAFESAGAFTESLFTVWANVFDRVRFTGGEAFLCHGGASGIGVMAIQMARLAGARRIFTTVGSNEKAALARRLGADRAINYRTENFVDIVKAEGGADVILDMVGGDYVEKNIAAANPDGRIINIAYQNGMQVTVNFGLVLMKRLTLAATTLRARPVIEKRRIRDAVERDFWPHAVSGAMVPVIDSVFPAAEAEAAQARMQSGEHAGKIILKW
jgi:NADPH:quinone reductase